jgi:hypothetical protein
MAKKTPTNPTDFDDSQNLHKLSRIVTMHLLKTIEGGEEITPALLAVAAAVLRNNAIVSLPKDPEVERLRDRVMDSLPFRASDEQERVN